MVTTQDKARVMAPGLRTIPKLYLVYSGDAPVIPPVVHAPRKGATPIGRDVANGIALPGDGRASRHHATLHLAPGGTVRVVDENSRNGTWVDGNRVRDRVLADGEVLGIGDSYFVVRDVMPDTGDAPVPELVGAGPAMCSVRSAIAQVGPERASVLILAETGCGKELVARALHARRPKGPFIAVNCSAIPESLAEAQLFGQLPGSFTGAVARPGLFAAADGGTLFLDELGELPAAIQPKLLRVLQERAVTPVGAAHPVPCDVRIVAATNRDLRADVNAGRFRADLYARLAELVVHVPPVRERREDLVMLLVHALGDPPARIGAALVEALLLHSFPFNVREVQAIASQLRLRGRGRPVLDLELVVDRLDPPSTDPPAARADDEQAPPDRVQLEDLLRTHRGVIADVARAMNRSRKQVYRWIEQNEIDVDVFR